MKRSVLMMFVLHSALIAQSSKELSLGEAIKLGRDRSRVLKASTMKLEAARAFLGEAETHLLPSLKFEAAYKRLSDVDPFQVQLPISPTPIVISPVVRDNYSMRLALLQPLFTGFRLRNNVRAAEFTTQAAEFDHESDEAEVTLAIKNAYWVMYHATELLKYTDENLRRLEAHLEDTQRLLHAGLATRNDELKIQVQVSSAKLGQIDARLDVRTATMHLNSVIGLPLDTGLQLNSLPQGVDQGNELPFGRELELHALMSHALALRPDLLALESRIRAGEATVGAVQGNLWPQIFLGGNYYYSRPNPRYLPTLDKFKDSWDIGVMLQVDIWNWGATAYQTDQAEAQLRQSEYNHDQMKDNISVEVARSYQQVVRSQEKISVAQLATEQAEENARVTADKYSNGLATSSDLLDAEIWLLQARTNHTGALVEFELSRARLTRAIGDNESSPPQMGE